MSLGISTEASGDFSPYIKWDSRAGRFFRPPNKEAGEKNQVDITMGFVAAMDLVGVQVGWADFPAGAAPSYVMNPVAKGLPDKPAGNQAWKQGFKMEVMLPGNPEVYELSSTAKACVVSIDGLHTAYSAAPEALAGKIPVFELTGTEIIETNSKAGINRNYSPQFRLTSWIDRPAVWKKKDAAPAASPAPAAGFGPAPTGSKAMEAPKAAAPQTFG